MLILTFVLFMCFNSIDYSNRQKFWHRFNGSVRILKLLLTFSILYTITPDDGLDLSRNMLWYTCLIKHAET
jgi:hypothetical protein